MPVPSQSSPTGRRNIFHVAAPARPATLPPAAQGTSIFACPPPSERPHRVPRAGLAAPGTRRASVQLKRWLVVAAVGLTATAAVAIASGGTGRPEPSAERLAQPPSLAHSSPRERRRERRSAGPRRPATRRKNITGASLATVAPRRGRRQRAAQHKHPEPPPPEPAAPATPAPQPRGAAQSAGTRARAAKRAQLAPSPAAAPPRCQSRPGRHPNSCDPSERSSRDQPHHRPSRVVSY